uniref:Reverse transcriptase domain-containing protein n=1 Tax=Tanacetum cinerariifolium TaxID=118510 RepID=A0A699GJ40_TANCI|nr:hypothetical protein [Tanacetum cinerariifolium]
MTDGKFRWYSVKKTDGFIDGRRSVGNPSLITDGLSTDYRRKKIRWIFDSMEHLLIHFPHKAILGGPTQYRWMYLFERMLGKLKRTVRNKARVEGSIVKSYKIDELSTYRSLYFDKTYETRLNRDPQNFAPDITGSSSMQKDSRGVCVRGSVYNDDVRDDYGMLDEVLEVEYHSESAHSVVVLFKCHWFDTVQGVKVNQKHVQVYYASYPSMTRELNDWIVSFKKMIRVMCTPSTSTDEEIEPVFLVIEREVEEVDNTIYEEDGDEEGEFEYLDDDSDEDMEDELSLSDHSTDDDYNDDEDDHETSDVITEFCECEYTCMLLKPLATGDIEVNRSDELGFFGPYYRDIQAYFSIEKFQPCTRTHSSSNLLVESPPNPSSSNPKRRNRRRSKQPFILEESLVDTMANQRTMAELLRAPTEGYAEAIVVSPILAVQFELKHNLINMMTSDLFFGLEKDNPHDHICWFNKITSTIKYKDLPKSAIKLMLFPFSLAGAARRWLEKEPSRSVLTWEDLVSKFINEFFPPSRTTNLRNEISNFQQQFDESFHEVCDRYKDLLRACHRHGFTELHQLDTFYNALNPADQDSLNFAAGGNLLERRTQDVLTIIENKSKVCNSRNKSIISQVKSSDANSNSSSEIAKLTHAVNQQTSAVTTAMTVILKQFQVNPPPASVKAVEEICVTCGGAHPYYQCLAADGNTFPELRDNIQGYVAAAAVNYNQVVPLSELEKVKRMNEANMKAMQTQINNVKNELRNEMKNFIQASMSSQTNELKNMMASFFQMNTASTSGSGSLPNNTIANPKGELRAITTRSGIVLDGPSVPIPLPFINPEEDERVEETLTDQDLAEYTIKVPPSLVQTPKPPSQKNFVMHQRDHLHPNIPYPSRMYKQKQQEKGEVQIYKFWQMFKQLHINITLADALILISKYQKMLKDLLSNKEKLLELANTPLNENCSAVILKKLLEKLGDPGKFLIPCGFSELKCKALADLGASINLMPLSIWKKLGLPKLISTRMTLELANRPICTPAGIARDAFVLVGKFTFPADFVIIDYESDPRVPLILGRPFLQIARALIDVHGEETILRDDDERLTLNMRHDTSSYSNEPQKESINMINVHDDSSKDFLENLFSTNHQSGNPTFSSHPILTSPEVKDDIFDPEGGNVLPKKLLYLDSTKDLHPPHHINPLSGSTTSSFPNHLLEEFTDELALITFPPKYDDDLSFDIESDLKEIEYLLHQDHIKDMDSILEDSVDQSNLGDLNDNLVDTMPEMFTDEHALDYSSPPLYDEYDDDLFEVESDTEYVYDDPFDSRGETIKEFKLLIDKLDLPSDFLPPCEYDSFLSRDFFEVDDLPSTNNEDKVFNSCILIQENLFKVITRVAPENNKKKLAIYHASSILEDFDPPLYELPVFKEVPRSKILLLFSSENEGKVSKPGILTSKEVHSFLIPELSHQGYKVFKINKILKSLIKNFLFFCGENIPILDVHCLYFYPP